MDTRRSIARLIAGLLACALACGIYLRHRQLRAIQEQPFGRYSEKQITARTVTLCRTILPDANGFLLSSERNRIYAQDGRQRLWWHLRCTDKAGKERMEFLWDAETGELAFVAHDPRRPVLPDSPPAAARSGRLPEAQGAGRAAWQAYRWLCWLGIAGEGQGWRLTKEPEHATTRCDVWYTRWQSADHKAVVQVDIGADTLISAQNWSLIRPPDP
jgi:hypothetical protein